MTNYDTVPWSDRALELKRLIDARISDPLLEELALETGEAWDAFFEATEQSERRAYRDVALSLGEALNAYKDKTALLAAELSKERPLDQFEGDTIGHLKPRGDYSGADSVPVWLSGRKHGFGGSDIGDALDVTKSSYSKSSGEVVDEKATLELDFDDTIANIKSKVSQFTGALGRGNAWETVIAQMFQREHADEFKVLEAKSTYYNPEHVWQTVNVDGLLCSDGVHPDGILEIKTSSKDWNGTVPIGYRAQVLNYLNATGFDYAFVAVLINDLYYEEYIIYSDETLSGKEYQAGSYYDIDFDDAILILDDLWADVIDERVRRYGRNWERQLMNMPMEFYSKAYAKEKAGELESGIVVYPDGFLESERARENNIPVRQTRTRHRRRSAISPELRAAFE